MIPLKSCFEKEGVLKMAGTEQEPSRNDPRTREYDKASRAGKIYEKCRCSRT